jgi:hypothetical protein
MSQPSHSDPLPINLTFRNGKTPTTTVERQRRGCIVGETQTSSLRARLQDNLARFVLIWHLNSVPYAPICMSYIPALHVNINLPQAVINGGAQAKALCVSHEEPTSSSSPTSPTSPAVCLERFLHVDAGHVQVQA